MNEVLLKQSSYHVSSSAERQHVPHQHCCYRPFTPHVLLSHFVCCDITLDNYTEYTHTFQGTGTGREVYRLFFQIWHSSTQVNSKKSKTWGEKMCWNTGMTLRQNSNPLLKDTGCSAVNTWPRRKDHSAPAVRLIFNNVTPTHPSVEFQLVLLLSLESKQDGSTC